MPIVLERYSTPDVGRLSFTVEVSAEIKVSAAEARRKVTGFLVNQLSYLAVGDRQPELVVGERVSWRVGVHHTLPGFGSVGRIGTIDVDVETGELLPIAEEELEEMRRRARTLASGYPLDSSPAR